MSDKPTERGICDFHMLVPHALEPEWCRNWRPVPASATAPPSEPVKCEQCGGDLTPEDKLLNAIFGDMPPVLCGNCETREPPAPATPEALPAKCPECGSDQVAYRRRLYDTSSNAFLCPNKWHDRPADSPVGAPRLLNPCAKCGGKRSPRVYGSLAGEGKPDVFCEKCGDITPYPGAAIAGSPAVSDLTKRIRERQKGGGTLEDAARAIEKGDYMISGPSEPVGALPAASGYVNDKPADGPTCSFCGAVLTEGVCKSCGAKSAEDAQDFPMNFALENGLSVGAPPAGTPPTMKDIEFALDRLEDPEDGFTRKRFLQLVASALASPSAPAPAPQPELDAIDRSYLQAILSEWFLENLDKCGNLTPNDAWRLTDRLIQKQLVRSMAHAPSAPAGTEKCPSCGATDNNPYTDAQGVSMRACGRCVVQWRAEAKAAGTAPQASCAAELKELKALLNTPEIEDFDKAVPLEAAHQIQRWGNEHDSGKNPEDWFWLVGYLAGKALASFKAGNLEKAKHHCISTSAALRNWHAHIRSGESLMRPGIQEPVAEARANAAPTSICGGQDGH